MAFYFKNTEEDISMTEEEEEDFGSNDVCRYCEKNYVSDKFRDYFHLTGKYRGPAHSICNYYVTQKQSGFLSFVFHNFSNYDCHFYRKLS